MGATKDGMTALHPEVLTASQRDVLEALGPFLRARDFYLVGGTAVAIHLGHRRSVDLDWFTGDALPDPLRLAEALRREIGGLDVGSVAPGTLHAEASGVLLSFLEYRYPLLRDLVDWDEYGCRLAPLEDLACMKLSAVSSRGARKDFIDIHALGRAGWTLDRMLSLYREKYETRDIGHVLYSLVYFDDAEPEEMPEMLSDVGWEDVKRTLEGWVRAYERDVRLNNPGD